MKEAEQQLIALLGKEHVRVHESMAQHTTFKTGGPADLFLLPHTAQEVAEAIRILRMYQIPYMVIGNGSNLLVCDGGIRGAVIQLSAMQQVAIQDDMLSVQCGALLSTAAAQAAQASLTGLEFAAGIPGTFGGAVVMNAGAYDGEMKDVLCSVEVLTEELKLLTLPVEVLELSYRHSIIPEKQYIVLGGTLRLQMGQQDTIYAKMAELAQQRREKQPLQYPSAGSTFKRPEGYFAGKLISDAGLKGKTIGGAQVSEKHAGFIVNIGHATAKDILDLIAYCQAEVEKQFGVRLETEIKIVGEL